MSYWMSHFASIIGFCVSHWLSVLCVAVPYVIVVVMHLFLCVSFILVISRSACTLLHTYITVGWICLFLCITLWHIWEITIQELDWIRNTELQNIISIVNNTRKVGCLIKAHLPQHREEVWRNVSAHARTGRAKCWWSSATTGQSFSQL